MSEGLLGAAIFFVFKALVEDRRLLESYGDAYRRYMAEVPRLVPRFKRRA